MKLRTIYTKFTLAAFAAWLLAAAGGCVREDGVCDGSLSGSPYHMTVTVVTSLPSDTRAGDDIHVDDAQEPGSEAESTIDFDGNDFRVLLFDLNGRYLLSLDGANKWEEFPHLADPSDDERKYVTYKMECEIEFPAEVTESDLESIRTQGFQVMVLANWKNANGDYAAITRTTQSLNEIWADGTNYNFAYSYIYNSEKVGYDAWLPSLSPKRLIPMFGYAKATKFEERTSGGKLYSTATIPMQRVVAKIEVLNNMKEQPSLSVGGVTLTKFSTQGRFIPNVAENPDWATPGKQVGKSSMPNGWENNVWNNLKFIPDASNTKWVAYVPEMALGELFMSDGRIDDNRAHLDIRIDSNLEFYEGDTYAAHFAKYDSNFNPTIPDPSWNHILRNHIYRFTVNKVGLTMDLHLHVLPWDRETDEEWDYTDNVTISDNLKWDRNTYENSGEAENSNEVILKLDGTVLRGSFTIAAPLHGRWYARLTPIGQAKPNAVSFVDSKGDILEPAEGEPRACVQISGDIDNREQFIYIRPTNFANDDESRFKLEFWVENMGVWINVPMPDGPYTIVRKANLIQ